MVEQPRRRKARAASVVRSPMVRLKAISGLGEREPLHHIGDGHGLGALGFHEFEPCRRRVEQVAHLDAGAGAERLPA